MCLWVTPTCLKLPSGMKAICRHTKKWACPFTAEEAQAALHTFLQKGAAFDAIFAASDLIAINAMGMLKGQGCRFPSR